MKWCKLIVLTELRACSGGSRRRSICLMSSSETSSRENKPPCITCPVAEGWMMTLCEWSLVLDEISQEEICDGEKERGSADEPSP